MSITDELRRYAANWDGWFYDDKDGGLINAIGYIPVHSTHVPKVINAIADRIDKQHAEERDKAYNEGVYDGIDADKNAMGYIKLPVDADGVPIHLGDVMDGTCPSGKHVSGTVSAIGNGVFWLSNVQFSLKPDYMHHHNEPTVEDVLREFAEKMNENIGMYVGEAIDADEWRDADAKTIAEYAAKLRLVGDDDE